MHPHADWWPPLLVVFLIFVLWALMFEREKKDDAAVIHEAVVNHHNVAQSLAEHTAQMLDRLRFYGHKLTYGGVDPENRNLVRSMVDQDRAFLRLMLFDSRGRLLLTTGGQPEKWQSEAALSFAASSGDGRTEEMKAGALPPAGERNAWSLPIFFRPQSRRGSDDSFVMALVDLGHFPRHFENMLLGKSGEIVIVKADGQEILRMHEGRLDFVESITGTVRLHRAFSETSGTLTERVRDAHDRIYAFRRVTGSPFAVLVSRTQYDVLFNNKATHRGYLFSTMTMTVVMLFFTLLWWLSDLRKSKLMISLASSQEENAQLIQQLEREKHSAYHLATHDKLTGLANRMLFNEIAGRYMVRAQRLRARFGVMFIDLDRFKPINDTHGHKAGDQVLIQVAQRLQLCVRQADLVSRFGGDEFVALVSDIHGSRDAENIAAKIVETLSQPFAGIVADELFVTPSIGIALFPDDSDEIDQLVKQADGAMYQAKEHGRATYVFADSALNRRNDQKNLIQAALPGALKNREIYLHYQPKVSLTNFGITGLEALARWHHHQLGQVSPADFVAVAEGSSLIVELGEYVIDAVCAQMARWQSAGLLLVPVAVNISPRHLRSPKLFSHIESALARYGVEPRLLEIEITETGVIDAGNGFIQQLQDLEALGIRLAIDDFGTGFSGLSHLRALPVSHLKIDRSFIKDIRNDVSDAKIVSSTISLAHNLDMLVIAEGVETREQLAHLRVNACDQAQGYLFSKPLPAEEIPALLKQPAMFDEDHRWSAEPCPA
jgi:diguanylate cyclase (GGDEF)-like protein